MAKSKSLRTQFRNQLLVSIGLLVLIYSVLLHYLFFQGLDQATHRSMMQEARHYAQAYANNPDYQLPRSDSFAVYIGRENLPPLLKQRFKHIPLINRELAIAEDAKKPFFKPPKESFFILPYPVANTDSQLLLVYDNKPPEHQPGHAPPPFKLDLITATVIAALLSIALILWLAGRLITQVLNPLQQLTQMAKTIDQDKPEQEFTAMQDNSEIGLVANTLHESLQRIHQFHQREKQFLQNASHELRTPIAVIGSSLDMIDRRIEQGKTEISDQLQYIRHANKDMRELTEALLWLGRDQELAMATEQVDLSSLVTTLCDDLAYLIAGRNIAVNIRPTNPAPIQLPLALCRIVLNNLIRIAFEHAWEGEINIQVATSSVSISNDVSRFNTQNMHVPSTRGESSYESFGLGLDIVKQIVDKQGWILQTCTEQDARYEIEVRFKR